jgi:hypothetical protein
MTSACLAISGVVMAFGLFRFQIMEVIPIARDFILEDISDAILVLDSHNRVADYNPACRAMLQIDKIIIAQPVEEVLLPSMFNPKLFEEIKTSQNEITLTVGQETKIIDLRIRPIYDQKNKLRGRLFHFRDITDKRMAEMRLEKTVTEFARRLRKSKLSADCSRSVPRVKKYRDDNGYWNEVENYIRRHSEAEFSHGICPDCMRKLYPDQYESLIKKGKIDAKSNKS